MTKPPGKMTLEKLAAMVAEGFGFIQQELRSEIGSVRAEIRDLRDRVDFLEASMSAKLLAAHNRLDDLALNRVKYEDLAKTNARVGRIEGRLGLA